MKKRIRHISRLVISLFGLLAGIFVLFNNSSLFLKYSEFIEEPRIDAERLVMESSQVPDEIGLPEGHSVEISDGILMFNDISYQIIQVDGGNRSGSRQALVAVDVGFGDRVYWALTNEYGQLVYVLADEIILQDDSTEPVNSDGRYYDDEANVPGTELEEYDQGHVIADSLGGVANAYNITPQDSTLNRHGDQAYLEKNIRDAGGCTSFVATITYENTTTQIPYYYHYTYTLLGSEIVDEFPNTNPDACD